MEGSLLDNVCGWKGKGLAEREVDCSEVELTVCRKGEAARNELVVYIEGDTLDKLSDRDFAFVLLMNALNGMLDYAQESGEGYPTGLPVEAADALREELEYCLLGGTN